MLNSRFELKIKSFKNMRFCFANRDANLMRFSDLAIGHDVDRTTISGRTAGAAKFIHKRQRLIKFYEFDLQAIRSKLQFEGSVFAFFRKRDFMALNKFK